MSKEWYSNRECDGEDIICPYCGWKYAAVYEETIIGDKCVDVYEEGEQGEFTCENCKKKFTLSVEMKYEYTTETISGEMTEDEWYEQYY